MEKRENKSKEGCGGEENGLGGGRVQREMRERKGGRKRL
jgi:hypothetical protein